ncbi:probable protein phosphatase 2C 59 [Hibiscus syriacus]|uniref:probable protein phosphatase 2C 59 n=1 Tax=Hibiscus syriacus TaxID=106335 RepID=UPI001923FA63|nr:probable protein phosphatase 2C 59 [Hibiscus syriacus]
MVVTFLVIRDAGSTTSTAILVGDRLIVANVGDSRAVICRGGNAIAVSRDHKPDQSDNGLRMLEDLSYGLICYDVLKFLFLLWLKIISVGTWRVGGVLAVSRAFGDRHLKQYVVADPEIQEEKIDSSLEFLILASDGLWDAVSNEEAVAIVNPIQDPEQAAKQLMQEASQRGSSDNITCVVVRFLVNQGGPSCNPSANQRGSPHSRNVSAIQGGSSCNFSAIQVGSPRNVTANQGGPPLNASVNQGGSSRNVSA